MSLEEVDLVYGYPGGAIMPVYDELYKFKETIASCSSSSRARATHAAQGFAEQQEKVGVAIATSGPATNLVTGIADAQMIPLQWCVWDKWVNIYWIRCFQETDIRFQHQLQIGITKSQS
jgi:acetolactate synthase-1/2/3 large subunit